MDMVPKDLRTARACLFCSLIKPKLKCEENWAKNEDIFTRIVWVPVRLFDDCYCKPLFHKLGIITNLRTVIYEARPENVFFQTFDQFEFDGCDNCDSFLRMKNNRDNVYDCTSSNFDGMIALMSPEDSWVAKWQRINRFSRGIYAISVAGKLPKGVLQDLKRRGIIYKPRDTSMR